MPRKDPVAANAPAVNAPQPGVRVAQPLLPVAEVEEVIYAYEPANNGSGPMWGNASSCIVRAGNDVFASGIETLKDVQPLNNVRWMLFKRAATGWELQQADPKGRTREPCPLGYFGDGRLMLSVNPTLTDVTVKAGPAEPQILELAVADPRGPYKTLLPVWDGKPAFTEHSYRSFAVDGPNRELIQFQNVGYTHAEFAFLDGTGAWSAKGQLKWAWGAEYEKPEPIRTCYPVLALKNRAVYFCGVSDIVEPNSTWREAKKAITGQNWDYDSRRLFFTWCPDITTGKFADWVEVASREKTCGWLFPCDLWVAPDGAVHLLWSERALDERLREKFYPGEKQTHSLNHAILRDGKVAFRSPLAIGGEGESAEIPGRGRFQVTADNRLFVFYYSGGADAKGQAVSENRVTEILPDGTHTPPVRVALEHPFTSFINATVRGGSAPSSVLDVLGSTTDQPAAMSYARINLLSPLRVDFDVAVEKDPAGTRVRLDAARSVAAAGTITAWQWDLDGAKLQGQKVEQVFQRGGQLRVSLTAQDDKGNRQSLARTVWLPLAPADLGLKQWGLVVRTESESFVAEGGGVIHVRTDKLAASGLSLSHWNTKAHWLEWEFEVPREDDYFLLIRYATPEQATRAFTLDGQPQPVLPFASTGGYGSDSVANWCVAVLKGSTAQPLALHLSSGTHRVRLENTDGTGLNLDYFDWAAKSATPDGVAEPPVPASLKRVTDADGCSFLLAQTGAIPASQIKPDPERAFTILLGPRYPGDGVQGGPESTLRLFEDGKELGPAHVAHKEIRELGQGRYSHWKDGIWFSTSDNSDPRTNGRKYTWRLAPTAP